MEIYSFLWLQQVAVLKEELLGDKGYEEIHCQVCLYEFKVNIDISVSYYQEKDLDCLELLCPIGWQWNSQMEECSLKRGNSKNVLHMIIMLILVTYNFVRLLMLSRAVPYMRKSVPSVVSRLKLHKQHPGAAASVISILLLCSEFNNILTTFTF